MMVAAKQPPKNVKVLIIWRLLNTGFPDFRHLFKLGVSFAVLNYICLVLMQIHAYFYFNYICYSGLLIFCCQNVAIFILSIHKILYYLFLKAISPIKFLYSIILSFVNSKSSISNAYSGYCF